MKIGILGAGQLSRMLALAGIPMGLDFCFYDPGLAHCVSGLGTVIQGDYTDQKKLKLFAEQVDLITYENENIPEQTLDYLEKIKPIYPDKTALTLSQDRFLEKNMFQELSIPTARYFPVENKTELEEAAAELGFPFFLKKRRGGYDGKGQIEITSLAALKDLPQALCVNAIAEEYMEFDREISMIAARNLIGETVFYDVSENRHKEGILFRTVNRIDDPLFNKASEMVSHVLKHLNYVGVLAVEFFHVGDKLYANEMAPRVHNSGHWTIEGATTSQFSNHLRAILGWTLGKTESVGFATLYNILGSMPEKSNLLKFSGLHLHDYQKAAQPGRKLGHVTILARESHSYPKTLENRLFGEM